MKNSNTTKKINYGKQFEADFKKSVPSWAYYYRLKDGTSSWGKEENKEENKEKNTRFQAKNDFDCWLCAKGLTAVIEQKSYAGASFPLTNIRDNQIKGLRKASLFDFITSGIIFDIRKENRTFFIRFSDFEFLMNKAINEGRKSIKNSNLIKYGIEITKIEKVSHYYYDIAGLIEKLTGKEF